jgi:hypothetical protein
VSVEVLAYTVSAPEGVTVETCETAHAPRTEAELAPRCIAPKPVEGSIRVELGLETADPGWLVPGLFYGESRAAACTRRGT